MRGDLIELTSRFQELEGDRQVPQVSRSRLAPPRPNFFVSWHAAVTANETTGCGIAGSPFIVLNGVFR